MGSKSKFYLRRVDVQVVLLTSLIVIFSCVVLNKIVYDLAYNDMIHSLEERVTSIVNYVESESFDLSTFETINTRKDIYKESYVNTKELFSDIRILTNAQYLYTAKLNDQGELIYVIDGLPMNSTDFRYPGDLIEESFQADLLKALRGEIVMPTNILVTEWGNVFVAYYPIHNHEDKIVGVIGIEFPANSQYKAYTEIRKVTPFIIAISCIVSAIFSIAYFRRISNPRHKDLSNTDYLTELKSRNAYEIDTQNRIAQKMAQNTGIIMIDLNGLKPINDSHGHETGDLYLKTFASSVVRVIDNQSIPYRTGGDEFIILVENATKKKCEDLICLLEKAFSKDASKLIDNPSFSAGYAICIGNKKEDWETAKKLADSTMYEGKKEFYSQKQGS